MDEIVNHIIIRLLKDMGFESADKRAILLINEALKKQIFSILKVLHFHTIHSTKQFSNFFDLSNLINLKYLDYNNKLIPSDYSLEVEERPVEFKSPLSTYLERYIHIYEFMPPFPPTHTFRQTFIKNKETEDKSKLVKTRLEQSLRSEKNLLKLIESSGTLPNFVNYLHKKK